MEGKLDRTEEVKSVEETIQFSPEERARYSKIIDGLKLSGAAIKELNTLLDTDPNRFLDSLEAYTAE